MITCLKIYIINIKAGVKSEFYNNEFKTNYKNNFKSEIACNKSLLLGFCSTKHYVLENIVSMLNFDIIHFSLLANLAFAIINQKFLASAVN